MSQTQSRPTSWPAEELRDRVSIAYIRAEDCLRELEAWLLKEAQPSQASDAHEESTRRYMLGRIRSALIDLQAHLTPVEELIVAFQGGQRRLVDVTASTYPGIVEQLAARILNGGAIESIELRTLSNLLSIERNAMLESLPTQNSAAIKAYREQHGVGLAEAIGGVHEPRTPVELLTSWRAITAALGLKHDDQDKVKRLNKRFGGPIPEVPRGSQPIVQKNVLIEWWNRLAVMQQDLANQHLGARLQAEAQHDYGRTGTVAPEISGSARKRRRDTKR